MKIGFDAKRAFHNTRGLGVYSRNLIYGLNKYFPETQCYLYSPAFDEKAREQYAYLFSSQNKVFIPQGLWKFLSSVWRRNKISDFAIEEGLDVYHGLSHELPFGLEKFQGKKIVTIHDLQYIKFPQFFSAVDRNTYHKKVKHACQIADVIIAICEQTKQDLIEHAGADESKIVVHYQSCSEIFYPENHPPLKKMHDKPYLLHVGAFVPNKNQITLVDAFQKVASQFPHDLILLGSGVDQKYLDDLKGVIEQTGLKQRVIIKMNISQEELVHYYREADLFCFPSFYEGFGIPIIEAMFSGTPVICSNTSSLPEAGGVAAEYFNPNNPDELSEKLVQVLQNEQKLSKMRDAGLEHVKQFHLEKTTAKLMQIYS